MAASDQRIVIIAGPNGAGKTTYALELLPQDLGYRAFVNADLIAAGLEPFQPERAAFRAGRLMLSEIASHVAAGESFGFETTLSGRGYARLIPQWQRLGYWITLIFLKLDGVETALLRVAERVRQGWTRHTTGCRPAALQRGGIILTCCTSHWWIVGRCTTIQAIRRC